MPELPEVEHARRRLTTHLAGRAIRRVSLPDPAVVRTRLSTRPGDAHPDARSLVDRLVGARCGPVLRHGKRLGWAIGGVDLLGHLGMTGRWIQRSEAPLHGRIGLHVDGADWWFEDARRFGCLAPAHGDLADAVREGLGPDALDPPPTGAVLASRLGSSRARIKTRLLDQERLAGIGNIQATEALWRARIHPARRADSLDPTEWDRLADGIGWTLRRTLQDAGDDELVYVSQDPTRSPFLVYGRVGTPCPSCETTLSSTRMGGRVTPYCPGCQPEPGPKT